MLRQASHQQSMTDQLRANRMATLEGWRIMAFSLGGPLGNVLSRSFDLITTVVRDGTGDEMSIGYSLESLKRERDLAMSRDGQRFDPLRNMLYGLSESLGAMIESIMDERRSAPRQLHHHQLQPQQSLQQLQQPFTLQPQQPQLQLLQLQLLLQDLHERQEEKEEWTNDSSDTDGPTLRTVKNDATESPDIVILEEKDQHSSSVQAESSTPLKESSLVETHPLSPVVPPLKIRRISEDKASISPLATCEKRDELPLSQPIVPPIVVTTGGGAPLLHQAPTRQESTQHPIVSPFAVHYQVIPPLTLKRVRVDDTTSTTAQNRWKHTCAPTMTGFFNEDDVDASVASAAAAAAAASPPTALYGCHECERTFDTKQGQKRHAFTHKAIHCPVCKKFVAKEKLKQHMRHFHDRDGESNKF